MPICSIDLHTAIPPPEDYPSSFNTIYDHIKARRIDRGLSKIALAKILDISYLTICSWENHHKKLLPRMKKKVINWLGYIPPLGVDESTLGGRLYVYRSVHGLTQKDISSTLKMDKTAISQIERYEKIQPYYYEKIKMLIEN